MERFLSYFNLKLLKLFAFLPALLMMYIIFSFSAQTGETSGSLSYEISFKLVTIGNSVTGAKHNDKELHAYAHKIEHPVRKLAHMTEYFLLALTVAFPLYLYNMRGKKLIAATVLFCIAFAAGDEYHQSFVAGRGPSIKDVLIDSVGAAIGTAISTVMFTRNKK